MSNCMTINVDCEQFLYRTITIFEGSDDEVTINVASTNLCRYLDIDNNMDNEMYVNIDNMFACYVDPMHLIKMDDVKLAKFVEENYYD